MSRFDLSDWNAIVALIGEQGGLPDLCRAPSARVGPSTQARPIQPQRARIPSTRGTRGPPAHARSPAAAVPVAPIPVQQTYRVTPPDPLYQLHRFLEPETLPPDLDLRDTPIVTLQPPPRLLDPVVTGVYEAGGVPAKGYGGTIVVYVTGRNIDAVKDYLRDAGYEPETPPSRRYVMVDTTPGQRRADVHGLSPRERDLGQLHETASQAIQGTGHTELAFDDPSRYLEACRWFSFHNVPLFGS